MWNRISGKASGTKDEEHSKSRRSGSTVSSNSNKKTPTRSNEKADGKVLSRGDDRDRGFNPTSTSFSSTTQSPYPGTASASVATASGNHNDEPYIPPGLVRNASVANQMPKSRSSRDERAKNGAKDFKREQRAKRNEDEMGRDQDDTKSEKRERRDRKDSDRGKESSRSTKSGRSRTGYGDSENTETSRGHAEFSDQVGASGFSQFPGQYNGGMPNAGGDASAHLSSRLQDQFPGQFPAKSTAPYRPSDDVNGGRIGLAAEYYGDAGESVAEQPGIRVNTPSLIVGAEPHLQPALAVAAPPPEPSASGGIGAAASFFDGDSDEQGTTTSHGPQTSSTFTTAPLRPQDSHHSTSAPAIPTLGGAAAGAAAGYFIGNQISSQTQRPHHTSTVGASQQPYSTFSHQRPPSPTAESYYSNTSRPERPHKQSSHSSNVPLYAAGVTSAAGLASANYHQSHLNSSGQSSSRPPNSQTSMAQRHHHYHGPLGAVVDFFKDPEGVAAFEEYSEITGVCRYCFAPGSSPRDAPRKHHYRRRRSNESLSRVDKESRYHSAESDTRRRKEKSWLANSLAGYGLAKVGESLFKQNNDFDDTYSLQTGRYSPVRSRQDSNRRTQSKDHVETGITSYGEDFKTDPSFYDASKSNTYGTRRRSRSRSWSRDRMGPSRSRRQKSVSPNLALVQSRRRDGHHSSEPRRDSHKMKNQKKKRGFFSMSSTSSSTSSVEAVHRSTKHGSSKRSGNRTNDDRRAEAAILGLGAAAAALAINDSRKPHKKKGAKDLIGAKETRESRSRDSRLDHRSEDEVWESAPEDEDESADSALAYGGSKRRGSRESVSSDSSGTAKWGWRWGGMKKSRNTSANSKPPKPNDLSFTAGLGDAGFAGAAVMSPDHYQGKGMDSNSSLPLQKVFPMPTSDPNRYDVGTEASIPSSNRPAAVPIQHPQPITPVSAALYSSQHAHEHSYSAPTGPPTFSHANPGTQPRSIDARIARPNRANSSSLAQGVPYVKEERSSLKMGRRDSSPARIGINAVSDTVVPRRRSSTKDDMTMVRFDRTEEQEENDRRERRRKRKDDKERREAEEQKQIEEEREASKQKSTKDYAALTRSERSPETPSETPWVAPAAVGVIGTAIGAASLLEKSKSDETREERRERRRREREREEVEEEEALRKRERRRNEREFEREQDIPDYVGMKPQRSTDAISNVLEKADGQPQAVGKRKSIWQEAASPQKSPKHEDYSTFFSPFGLGESNDQTKVTSANPNANIDFDQEPAIVTVTPKGLRDPDLQPTFSPADTDDIIDTSKLSFPVPKLRLVEPSPPSTRSSTPIIEPRDLAEKETQEEPTTKATPSRVTWGDDQTHEYFVISPGNDDDQDEFIESRPADEINERSLAGASEPSDTTVLPEDASRESKALKFQESKDVPTSYGDDIGFAATLAASAEDAGFDPSIVIDDPKYRRRDSPPGSNDRSMPGSFDDDETSVFSRRDKKKGRAKLHNRAEGHGGRDDNAVVQDIISQVEGTESRTSKDSMEDVDYAWESGKKFKSKKSKKARKEESGSKDDFHDLPEHLGKPQDLEMQETITSLPEDNVDDAWESGKKFKSKKSKKGRKEDLGSKDDFHESSEQLGKYQDLESQETTTALPEDDVDDAWESGKKSKSKKSKKGRKEDLESKDDFHDSSEQLSKSQEPEIREMTATPPDDTLSLASSLSHSNGRGSSKKSRKKSIRDITSLEDTVSNDSASTVAASSEIKSQTKKSSVWDRVLGRSSQENGTKDLAKEATKEDFDEPKKKGKKSKGRRSTGDEHGDDATSSTIDATGEQGFEQEASNGASIGQDSGRTTQGPPAKDQDASGNTLDEAEPASDHPQNSTKPMNVDEQRPEYFLDVRPDPPLPPDKIHHKDEPPDPLMTPDAPVSPPSTSEDQARQQSYIHVSEPLASPTAVPFDFRFSRPRPSIRSARSMSQTPPASPHFTTDLPPRTKPRPRSTEFKSSNEFRPLMLVERHRSHQESAPEEAYPSLPSSHTTSRSSSVRDPEESDADQRGDYEQINLRQDIIQADQAIAINTTHSRNQSDLLDSQQATPTASSFQQSATGFGDSPLPEGTDFAVKEPSTGTLSSAKDAVPASAIDESAVVDVGRSSEHSVQTMSISSKDVDLQFQQIPNSMADDTEANESGGNEISRALELTAQEEVDPGAEPSLEEAETQTHDSSKGLNSPAERPENLDEDSIDKIVDTKPEEETQPSALPKDLTSAADRLENLDGDIIDEIIDTQDHVGLERYGKIPQGGKDSTGDQGDAPLSGEAAHELEPDVSRVEDYDLGGDFAPQRTVKGKKGKRKSSKPEVSAKQATLPTTEHPSSSGDTVSITLSPEKLQRIQEQDAQDAVDSWFGPTTSSKKEKKKKQKKSMVQYPDPSEPSTLTNSLPDSEPAAPLDIQQDEKPTQGMSSDHVVNLQTDAALDIGISPEDKPQLATTPDKSPAASLTERKGSGAKSKKSKRSRRSTLLTDAFSPMSSDANDVNAVEPLSQQPKETEPCSSKSPNESQEPGTSNQQQTASTVELSAEAIPLTFEKDLDLSYEQAEESDVLVSGEGGKSEPQTASKAQDVSPVVGKSETPAFESLPEISNEEVEGIFDISSTTVPEREGKRGQESNLSILEEVIIDPDFQDRKLRPEEGSDTAALEQEQDQPFLKAHKIESSKEPGLAAADGSDSSIEEKGGEVDSLKESVADDLPTSPKVSRTSDTQDKSQEPLEESTEKTSTEAVVAEDEWAGFSTQKKKKKESKRSRRGLVDAAKVDMDINTATLVPSSEAPNPDLAEITDTLEESKTVNDSASTIIGKKTKKGKKRTLNKNADADWSASVGMETASSNAGLEVANSQQSQGGPDEVDASPVNQETAVSERRLVGFSSADYGAESKKSGQDEGPDEQKRANSTADLGPASSSEVIEDHLEEENSTKPTPVVTVSDEPEVINDGPRSEIREVEKTKKRVTFDEAINEPKRKPSEATTTLEDVDDLGASDRPLQGSVGTSHEEPQKADPNAAFADRKSRRRNKKRQSRTLDTNPPVAEPDSAYVETPDNEDTGSDTRNATHATTSTAREISLILEGDENDMSKDQNLQEPTPNHNAADFLLFETKNDHVTDPNERDPTQDADVGTKAGEGEAQDLEDIDQHHGDQLLPGEGTSSLMAREPEEQDLEPIKEHRREETPSSRSNSPLATTDTAVSLQHMLKDEASLENSGDGGAVTATPQENQNARQTLDDLELHLEKSDEDQSKIPKQGEDKPVDDATVEDTVRPLTSSEMTAGQPADGEPISDISKKTKGNKKKQKDKKLSHEAFVEEPVQSSTQSPEGDSSSIPVAASEPDWDVPIHKKGKKAKKGATALAALETESSVPSLIESPSNPVAASEPDWDMPMQKKGKKAKKGATASAAPEKEDYVPALIEPDDVDVPLKQQTSIDAVEESPLKKSKKDKKSKKKSLLRAPSDHDVLTGTGPENLEIAQSPLKEQTEASSTNQWLDHENPSAEQNEKFEEKVSAQASYAEDAIPAEDQEACQVPESAKTKKDKKKAKKAKNLQEREATTMLEDVESGSPARPSNAMSSDKVTVDESTAVLETRSIPEGSGPLAEISQPTSNKSEDSVISPSTVVPRENDQGIEEAEAESSTGVDLSTREIPTLADKVEPSDYEYPHGGSVDQSQEPGGESSIFLPEDGRGIVASGTPNVPMEMSGANIDQPSEDFAFSSFSGKKAKKEKKHGKKVSVFNSDDNASLQDSNPSLEVLEAGQVQAVPHVLSLEGMKADTSKQESQSILETLSEGKVQDDQTPVTISNGRDDSPGPAAPVENVRHTEFPDQETRIADDTPLPEATFVEQQLGSKDEERRSVTETQQDDGNSLENYPTLEQEALGSANINQKGPEVDASYETGESNVVKDFLQDDEDNSKENQYSPEDSTRSKSAGSVPQKPLSGSDIQEKPDPNAENPGWDVPTKKGKKSKNSKKKGFDPVPEDSLQSAEKTPNTPTNADQAQAEEDIPAKPMQDTSGTFEETGRHHPLISTGTMKLTSAQASADSDTKVEQEAWDIPAKKGKQGKKGKKERLSGFGPQLDQNIPDTTSVPTTANEFDLDNQALLEEQAPREANVIEAAANVNSAAKEEISEPQSTMQPQDMTEMTAEKDVWDLPIKKRKGKGKQKRKDTLGIEGNAEVVDSQDSWDPVRDGHSLMDTDAEASKLVSEPSLVAEVAPTESREQRQYDEKRTWELDNPGKATDSNSREGARTSAPDPKAIDPHEPRMFDPEDVDKLERQGPGATVEEAPEMHNILVPPEHDHGNVGEIGLQALDTNNNLPESDLAEPENLGQKEGDISEPSIQDLPPTTAAEVEMLDDQEQREYDHAYAKELERQLSPLQEQGRSDPPRDDISLESDFQRSIDSTIATVLEERTPLARPPPLEDILEEPNWGSGSLQEATGNFEDQSPSLKTSKKGKKGKKSKKQVQPLIWEDETATPPIDSELDQANAALVGSPVEFRQREDPDQPIDLEEPIQQHPLHASSTTHPAASNEAEDYFAIQPSQRAEEDIGGDYDRGDFERSLTANNNYSNEDYSSEQVPSSYIPVNENVPSDPQHIEMGPDSTSEYFQPEKSTVNTSEAIDVSTNSASTKRSKKGKKSSREEGKRDPSPVPESSEQVLEETRSPAIPTVSLSHPTSPARNVSYQQAAQREEVPTLEDNGPTTSHPKSNNMNTLATAIGTGVAAAALVDEGVATQASKKGGKKGKKGKKATRWADLEDETIKPRSPVTEGEAMAEETGQGPISQQQDNILAWKKGAERAQSPDSQDAPESQQDFIGTSLQSPISPSTYQSTVDPSGGYTDHQQSDLTGNRDSAINVFDSPTIPEDMPVHRALRDSGYPETEPSPTLTSEPMYQSIRSETPTSRTRDTKNQQNASENDESPRTPEHRRSASPPLVPLNFASSQDFSATEPGHRERRSKSYDSDDSADSGFDIQRRRRRQAKAKDAREPSPVSSTTKDRSSALFDSSPSARGIVSDPPHKPSASTSNDPIRQEPTWSFAHGDSLPLGAQDVPSETQTSDNLLDQTTYDKLTGRHGGSSASLFGGPMRQDEDAAFDSMSPPSSEVRGRNRRLDVISEDGQETSSLYPKDNRALSDVGSSEAGVKEARVQSPPATDERDSYLTASPHLGPVRSGVDVGQPLDEFENRGRGKTERGSGRHSDLSNLPNMTAKQREGEYRTASAASAQSDNSIRAIIRTPDQVRSVSGQSYRSSGTPPLRRVDRSVSGDLRGASKLGEAKLRAKSSEAELELDRGAQNISSIPSSSTYDPVTDKGKSRAGMADVYEGWGDVRGQSPMSPTRPPSMRKRQSMQLLDLETRLDQLVSENRLLQTQKSTAEKTLKEQTRDHSQQRHAYEEALEEHKSFLAQKDAELDELKEIVEDWQSKVTQLTEVNEGLHTSTRAVDDNHNARYKELEAEHLHLRERHAELTTGMEALVQREVASHLEEKNSELQRLRVELGSAKQQVRSLQQQLLVSRESEDFVERDEDYFDSQCQSLCQHVQQWVLRFSKFSDTKACYRASEIRDETKVDRMENAILDGTDVDMYLQDRVKRRDVLMAVVMTMIFDYIFTRYLFGMDREQRQKLKNLEKTLQEIGPASAVCKWRATTLTLLMKRDEFAKQRTTDTEAIVHEIYDTLAAFLPPPSHLVAQIQDSLRKVIKSAADLSIEMRTQRADYQMLPPLQPDYDINGDLAQKVYFNALTMNERSGATTSNQALQEQGAVVRMVLFPLVVKNEEDDEQIIVCPAQVLTADTKVKKTVRVMSVQGSTQGGRSEASFAGSEGGMF